MSYIFLYDFIDTTCPKIISYCIFTSYLFALSNNVGRRASSVVRCRPSESVKDTDELTRSLGAAPPGLVEALAQVGEIVLGQLSFDIFIYFSIDNLCIVCMIFLLIHLFSD